MPLKMELLPKKYDPNFKTFLLHNSKVRSPTIQGTDLKTIIHHAATQTAVLSKQKVFFQDTKQCTPLLPKQGLLLVCYWSPQPHSTCNSHKIGKYNFIKLFTVGARLNPQSVLR
jgi:hypothetical protein